MVQNCSKRHLLRSSTGTYEQDKRLAGSTVKTRKAYFGCMIFLHSFFLMFKGKQDLNAKYPSFQFYNQINKASSTRGTENQGWFRKRLEGYFLGFRASNTRFLWLLCNLFCWMCKATGRVMLQCSSFVSSSCGIIS